jgi:AmmeMemoRadiSam system protein B/AmmeMemoRadiSam system protein A
MSIAGRARDLLFPAAADIMNPVRRPGPVAALLVLLAAVGAAQNVRPAAFAGIFYPAGAAELAAWIDGAMAAASPDAPAGRVIGLIAPHAGYVYSGRTAAAAYALVRGGPYETVVIIAPSHRVAFEGVSVWPDGGFETPLGLARVDAALAKDIARAARSTFRREAFAEEHALEVQVPFVQRALPAAAIVPVVMGLPTRDTVRTLAAALAKTCLGKNVLVVASTDLSHFLPKARAEATDAATAELIKSMRTDTIIRQAEAGENIMCGGGGVAALLLLAEKAGRPKVEILARADSSSFGGPVVGYLAAAVLSQAPAGGGPGFTLSTEAKADLLRLARSALTEYCAKRTVIDDQTGRPELARPRGAFVTLTKRGALRGCIGFIEPVAPLGRTIIQAAIYAATEDPRFPPVAASELQDLRIEISVLTPLSEIDGPREVRVGTHGLVVERDGRRGLLLPQVAVENGWDRETFLDEASLKAGLPRDAWKRGAKLFVFEAIVFHE